MTYVEVVELKLGESVIEGSLNKLGAVAVVPQLGGDEDVLTAETGDLLEGLLDTLGDLLLVLVDLGQVEVTVAGLEGLVDTGTDLTRGGLPGTVAQSGDLGPGVEGGGLSERHCGCFLMGLLVGKV